MRRDSSRSIKLFLAFLLVVGLALPVRADDGDVRRALEPLYARMCQSLEHRRIEPILALVTPDYSETEMDGTIGDLDRFKASLRDLMTRMQTIHATYRIRSIRMDGPRADVTVESRVTGTFTQDGVQHTVDSRSVSEDTWVPTEAGWRMKTSSVLDQHIHRDDR